ncbi:MAG: polysaccharide lyase beta-sandwich domain-containing protein [Tannerella sp.]|jgi:chondroitin AC lyase|nr:polysaccharide lyase beta-sandwich domain-containing protein [Tannerella sp.]
MMKTTFIAAVLITCFYSCTQKQTSDMDRLRDRITAQCLYPNIHEDRLQTILASVREDGTWPDIDYVDTSRIAFQHVKHLDNLILMARAYKKEGSKYKNDSKLKQTIDTSLNFWLKHDFICENWWNNQIGTPNSMITLLYILDEDLTQDQKDRMIRIAGRANMDAPGARPSGDRITIAGLYAKTELYRRNEKQFEDILKIIEGEMKFFQEETDGRNAEGVINKNYFSGGRGMQQDYSFHHRPDRVNNTTTYGLGFLSSFVEFAGWVNDTKYKFSDPSLRLSIDYFLDGICKQMVYGRSVDPGVLNRDISRRGAGRNVSPDLPENFLKLSDYRKKELENIVKARKGEPFDVTSYAKFFWQTEYFSFQRPSFFTSVRMFSTRNDNMEVPYNGEGLLNHYRADGANYLSMEGNEYLDIAPVYDYRKIPGATIVQADTMPNENKIQKKGLTGFVGGVTDGTYGAVAFDFKSPHNPLSAKKSWFFFDDLYVCLGAAINSTDKYPVATTLNQCFLKGDVLVNDGVKTNTMKNGERLLDNAGWIFHDNVGYIFPGVQKTGLSNQTESGSWYRINRQTSTSRKEVKEDVFCLWIDHGIQPVNAGYEYIIMPAAKIEDIEKYIEKPSVQIISNTSKIQAVKNNQVAYCVFYEAGNVRLSGDLTIQTDAPCMLLVHFKEQNIQSIAVSDPSRKLETVALTIHKKLHASGENITVKSDGNRTTLSIKLPRKDFAGKSEILQITE